MDKTSLFDVIASDDRAERQAGTRAKSAVKVRVGQQFQSFIALAKTQGEFNARISLISDRVERIVDDVCTEYNASNRKAVLASAVEQLHIGGHKSDCTCGFCKNKGKLFEKDDDEESDEGDDKKESRKKAHPSRAKLPDAFEREEEEEDDEDGFDEPPDYSPEDEEEEDEDEDEEPEHEHEGSVKVACDCCEDCKEGRECNCGCADCAGKKRSHLLSREYAASSLWFTAAEPLDEGDHYLQTRESLPAAGPSGLGTEGSPKIDKSRVPKDGLKPIDIPSVADPLTVQSVQELTTGDRLKNDMGDRDPASPIRTFVDAQSPMQPEHTFGDHTDTWTGMGGQTDAVTDTSLNTVSSKWKVVIGE